MQLKHAIVGTLAALAVVVAAERAQAQFYVGVSGGYLKPENTDFDLGRGITGNIEGQDGAAINLAGGYKFPFGLRTELELGYLHSAPQRVNFTGLGGLVVGGGSTNTVTGTVNAFYEVSTGTIFEPYVGGGAGIAHSDSSSVTVAGLTASGGNSTDFLWFGEVGMHIKLTPNFGVVPAYRYIGIQDGGNGVDDTRAHLFKIGLRFGF